MAQIALVGVNLNAANFMTEYLAQKAPQFKLINYLDSFITKKTATEGGISDSSMKRMFDMLSVACDDGADGIILTCTVFTPYVEYFSSLLSKPIVSPDKSMLETVASLDGKKAILCTFSSTLGISENMYRDCCRRMSRDANVDMVLIDDAFKAAERSDLETHDRLIQEMARTMDEAYDHLVFAQISMAKAAEGLTLRHASVYTSPQSAFDALKKLLQSGK